MVEMSSSVKYSFRKTSDIGCIPDDVAVLSASELKLCLGSVFTQGKK